MKLSLTFAVLILSGCGGEPGAPAPAKPAVTTEPWYAQSVAQLQVLSSEANAAFARHDQDRAAALIQQGEPLAAKLLSAPQPTLAALQAASDLDDLYGRMLLANKHYSWARMMFQKNQARWRHWEPQTPDVVARRQRAEAAIAECDRRASLPPSPPPQTR